MIDGLISDDEIQECRNILNEYENEKISRYIKTNQTLKFELNFIFTIS